MLDRSSSLVSNDFSKAEGVTSSKTRNIAAKKILKFFLINSDMATLIRTHKLQSK